MIALLPSPSFAQGVNLADPAPRLVVSYAGNIGILMACGPVGTEDQTEELAEAVASNAVPGFWSWLFGYQAEYRDELLRAAANERLTEAEKPCRAHGLEGSYRSLLEASASTLLTMLED